MLIQALSLRSKTAYQHARGTRSNVFEKFHIKVQPDDVVSLGGEIFFILTHYISCGKYDDARTLVSDNLEE